MSLSYVLRVIICLTISPWMISGTAWAGPVFWATDVAATERLIMVAPAVGLEAVPAVDQAEALAAVPVPAEAVVQEAVVPAEALAAVLVPVEAVVQEAVVPVEAEA